MSLFVAICHADTLRLAVSRCTVSQTHPPTHTPPPLPCCVCQDVDLRKTVDESARIQRAYSHYFDLTIVNDNLDHAFEILQAAVDKLCSEPQWVPVNWVY